MRRRQGVAHGILTRETPHRTGGHHGTRPAGCSGDDGGSADGGDSYTIGINQLVQHPALDSATEGFKQAFADAGVDVDFDEQNANGEQATALTIAQQMASDNLDLALAVATPAAQAMAQNLVDTPLLFTAVTDPVEAELVESMEVPGGNVTGTSDAAPIEEQLELLKEIVPDAETVGIVYASGEVNSQVQVDQATEAAGPLGLTIETQTVTTVNEIQQVSRCCDVDATYVPTDNMVVSGIASLRPGRRGQADPRIAPRLALSRAVPWPPSASTTLSWVARPAKWRCASCRTATRPPCRWRPPPSHLRQRGRRRASGCDHSPTPRRGWKK